MSTAGRSRQAVPAWIAIAATLVALHGCAPPQSVRSAEPRVTNKVDDAISAIGATDDICEQLDLVTDLVSYSREDSSVVFDVADAVRRSGSASSKVMLVNALVSMWHTYGDEVAHAEIITFLGDEDVSFQAAIALAQMDDDIGAAVLRRVAASDQAADATQETFRDAQEARYWLEEMGLDWREEGQ